MKRNKFFSGIVMVLAAMVLAGCSLCGVDGDEEGVFIKKPYIFGKGGVDPKALVEGSAWKVFSTDFVTYKHVPVKYTETFDDVFCDDNTPLDLSAHLTLRIQRGKSPILHMNYGQDWYSNNIKENFREIVRNFISTYDMYTLVSNREVYDSVKVDITEKLQEYIVRLDSDKEFPVDIVNVVVDKAKPNSEVMAELNKTATMAQQKQTQLKQQEMEEQRRITENKRALADKEYQKQMGLSPEQFIALRALELENLKVEMVRDKPNVNVDVLLGNHSSTFWDIKKK